MHLRVIFWSVGQECHIYVCDDLVSLKTSSSNQLGPTADDLQLGTLVKP